MDSGRALLRRDRSRPGHGRCTAHALVAAGTRGADSRAAGRRHPRGRPPPGSRVRSRARAVPRWTGLVWALAVAGVLSLGAPAAAQEEFRNLFAPELGKLLIRSDYRVTTFPDQPVAGQPAELGLLQQDFSLVGAAPPERHRRVVRVVPRPEPGIRHGSRPAGYRRAVPGRAVERPLRHELPAPLRVRLDRRPRRHGRVAERQAVRELRRDGHQRDGSAARPRTESGRVDLLPELREQPGVPAAHPDSRLRVLVPAVRAVLGRHHHRVRRRSSTARWRR